MRNREPDRARASRALRRRAEEMAGENPPRGCDLPRTVRVRGAGRLLRRPEPRAADFANRTVFLAARRIRLPEALERDRGLAQGREQARALGRDARPRRGIPRARALGGAEVARQAQGQTVSAGPEQIIREEVRAMQAYAVARADGLV